MKKYTFVCEFKKGTYISQYKSDNLRGALVIWSENLDINFYQEKDKERIISEVKSINNEPIAIKGIDNVWCMTCLIKKSLLLLNIIETT